MKKIIMVAVLMLVLAGTVYGINTMDNASDEAMKTTAITAAEDAENHEDVTYAPETCVKVLRVIGSRAAVRVYSTTEITEPISYDLYTIKKKNGKWTRRAYIRTIEVPAVDNTRSGKYSYYSDTVRLDWLSEGHVYQLIPREKGNNHSSLPFWRNDAD